MRVVESTLKPVIEPWQDPGDYPSAAGGGPLASCPCLAGLAGHVVVELEAGDRPDWQEAMLRQAMALALAEAQEVEGATVAIVHWRVTELNGPLWGWRLEAVEVIGEVNEPEPYHPCER